MNLQTFLLISKDSGLRQLVEAAAPHIKIYSTDRVSEGLALWSEISPDLIVGEGNAHTLAPLLEYAEQFPVCPPLLVIGDSHSVKEAVEIVRASAADYLARPICIEDLDCRHLDAQASYLGSRFVPADPFTSIISISAQMNLMKQLAKEVALTDATVLITGESGTGKELFAEAIHRCSLRANGPLITLNCGEFPKICWRLSYSGMNRVLSPTPSDQSPADSKWPREGRYFLNEIGEMSPAAQAKLLRVLENHTIDPLGDTRSRKINIRIIAATNEDLLAHIKTGRFRLDLYYRLNVYQLRIPPLRERREDIEPILLIFLERAKQERGCRTGDRAGSSCGPSTPRLAWKCTRAPQCCRMADHHVQSRNYSAGSFTGIREDCSPEPIA